MPARRLLYLSVPIHPPILLMILGMDAESLVFDLKLLLKLLDCTGSGIQGVLGRLKSSEGFLQQNLTDCPSSEPWNYTTYYTTLAFQSDCLRAIITGIALCKLTIQKL